MIMKTLTAGVLAVSMALTSLTPTTASAEISEGDAIVGIVTLLLLGAALSNNDNDHPAPVAAHPRPRDNNNPGWRSVPARCRDIVTARNGRDVDFFALNCLRDNYAHVNRLPQACYVRFRRNEDSFRMGYRTRCLRENGFRTDRY